MFGRTDGSAASAANARSASGVVGSVGRLEMSSTNTDPPVRKARVRSGSGSAIQLSSSFSDIRSSADQWNDAITPRTRVRGLTRRSLAAAERERSDSMGGLRSLSRHASGGHEVNEVVGNLDDDDSNEDGTTSGGAQPTRVHGLEHLEKMNYHHSWHGRDTHLIEQWARIVAARQEAPDKYKRYIRHVGSGIGARADKTLAMSLVPPLNFAMVAPGLYRSGYPNKKNFPFLIKLGIKTVVYLGEERYLEKNKACLQGYGIQIFQFKMEGNLEPFSEISRDVLVVDQRHHPVLVHCKKGNHSTGCLVGCLRRAMHWSHTAICEEYRRHTGANVRLLDLQCIELFDPPDLRLRRVPGWVT